MQVVGRSCELCQEKLRSELGAFGCPACDLAIHEACVATATSYRAAAVSSKKPARAVPCPRCGDDLRARKRREDRERDAIIERSEESRRVASSRNEDVGRGSLRMPSALRVGIFVASLLFFGLLRLMLR